MKYCIRNIKSGEYYTCTRYDDDFKFVGEVTVPNEKDAYAVDLETAVRIIDNDVGNSFEWEVA